MLRRRSQLIQRKMHLKAENKWKTVDRLTIYLKDQQHQNKICYRNKTNVSAPIPAEEQMPMSFFWTFLVLFHTALGETEIWWHGTCHKCPCCSWCKRVNKKTWGGRATKAKVKKLLKISRLNYSLHVGTFLYQYSQVRGEEHVLRNGLYWR